MSFWTETLRPALKIAAGLFTPLGIIGLSGALALISAGISDAQSQRAKKKARAAYNASQRDRQQMIASATSPRQDVYGRQVVSGTVLFKHSAGAKKEYLYLAVELARHEIDAIEAVYIGDIEVTGWAANGDVTSGPFVKGLSGVSLAQRTGPGTITIAPPAGSTATIVSAHKSTDAGDVDITGSVTLSGSTVTVSSAAVSASESVYVNWAWSQGKPLVRIYTALGGADQTAFAAWQSEIGDKWTAAHRLRGRAAVGVRLEYDQDVFGSLRDVSIRARVRGKKLRDPRTGLTVYSNNSALITADVLRTRMGATAAQVPDAEIAAEADISDQITVGQKRYTCDIALSTDLSPKDALDLVRETMDGSVIWAQGRWRVRAGAWHEPDITLTGADLAEGSRTLTPRAQRQSLCNSVVATYTSPAANWVLVPAPAVGSATYLAQDNGYGLPMPITIEGATDEIRAQRLARIELEKTRNGGVFAARWSANAYDLVPGETCYVQIEKYFGALSKAFVVVERKLDLQSLEIELTLRETASGIWEWSGAIGQDLTPNTSLPSPLGAVAMLTGVTAVSGNSTLLQLADGTVISRVRLSWTQHPDAFVVSGGRIEVEWRRASGDTAWIGVPPVGGDATGTVIGPLDDRAAVLIRVRPVNAAGRAGAWRVVSHVVAGKSAPPTAPTALTVTEGPSGERIYSVTHVQDLDHAGYIVRASGTLTHAWDQMAQVAAWTGPSTQYRSGSPGDGQWRFAVVAVDTSGNLSAPVYVTATLTQQAIGWTDVAGRPRGYRVVTTGGSAVVPAPGVGLFDAATGALVAGVTATQRSYNLAKFERTTGTLVFFKTYDIYANGWGGGTNWQNAAGLTIDLNAATSSELVVVWTYDEPQANRLHADLLAAMLRCGASAEVYGSDRIKFRGAYVLIGWGGCGAGNGYEAYRGPVNSSPDAWLDIPFTIQSGQVMVGAPGAARFGSDIYGQAETSDIAEDAATSVLVSRYSGAMTLVGPNTGTVIRQLYYTADGPCKLQIRLSYTYEKNVATVPNGSDPADVGSTMSFNLTFAEGGVTGWPDTAFYIDHVGLEGVVSYTHTVNIPAAGSFRIFTFCTAITGINIYLYDPVLNVEVIKR